MLEQVAWIIVGAFVTGVVTFTFWYFGKRGEVKPHKTPCDHLVQLREEHERLADRFADHCNKESQQWNSIAESLGFLKGTLKQVDKRLEALENYIKGKVGA